eukprot:CAMPEP_0172360222 /NCGR_PEP_ID=MMETSP1060-20121228/4298_1 /TAXON_ID=37318 /ORGANISM="Pseudo-nitzschia pungens, Strain cf. cingulata" /LENGTH=702 /DNA_ID=CAMNT_0013082165 /DNA_START=173 /DNA_END=2281 /DNA_ORIENTATION=+
MKGFGVERMGVRFVVLFAALAVVLTTEYRSGNLLDWQRIAASAYEICGGNGVGLGDSGSWEGNDTGNDTGNDNDNDSHGGNEFICPTGNTCCRMAAPSSDSGEDVVSWGCIASDMGAQTATCCDDGDDGDDGARNTGCPSGYECRRREEEEGGGGVLYDCFLAGSDSIIGNDNPPPGVDPLLQVLPRYRLCKAEANNRRLYGLPVHSERFSEKGVSPTTVAELAYYSNLGPINDPNNRALSSVDMALIVVHGANRNGDDYFCSAKATIDLRNRFGKNSIDSHADDGADDGADDDAVATSVLVVAPDFRSSSTSERFLYWDEANGDRNGSWRYGADASGPVSGVTSSFETVDALVSTLRSATLFPGMRRIVVVGHSSGGQFVQRWSLLTPSEVWPPTLRDPIAPWSGSGSGSGSGPIAIHAVVANPSNYVYFTPLRFLADDSGNGSSNSNSSNHRNDKGLRSGNHESTQGSSPSSSSSSWSWRLPSKETRNDHEDCPGYNQWEYGLEDGGSMNVPYWQRVMARDSKARIVHRYLSERSVSYLIGDLDRCDDDGTNRRCQSHGLETTCADELQGKNRYERNALYLASLELEPELYHHYHYHHDHHHDHDHYHHDHDHYDRHDTNGSLPWEEEDATGKTGVATNHRRIVVPDVGHDHSMIFQSEQGIHAIYYAVGTTTTGIMRTIEDRSVSEGRGGSLTSSKLRS